MVAELGRVLVGTSMWYTQDVVGTCECDLYAAFYTSLGRDCASDRSPWNCDTHVFQILSARLAGFKHSSPNHLPPAFRTLKLRFTSAGLLPQVSLRSRVHSAVTRWRCHTWIYPTHFFAACQHDSCRVRLQTSLWANNTSSRTRAHTSNALVVAHLQIRSAPSPWCI